MKHLLCASLLLVALTVSFAGANQPSSPSRLQTAFTQISTLNGFTPISQEDLEDNYSTSLGAMRGVARMNSTSSAPLLSVLGQLPEQLLYAELQEPDNQITRFYIEKLPDGKAQLLLTFVASNGGDAITVLFSGQPEEVYQEAVDDALEEANEEYSSQPTDSIAVDAVELCDSVAAE